MCHRWGSGSGAIPGYVPPLGFVYGQAGPTPSVAAGNLSAAHSCRMFP